MPVGLSDVRERDVRSDTSKPEPSTREMVSAPRPSEPRR
jgi:hypothetical protein